MSRVIEGDEGDFRGVALGLNPMRGVGGLMGDGWGRPVFAFCFLFEYSLYTVFSSESGF